MSNPTVTDAVGLSIVIAASIFSPEVAAVVGPYVLIAVASIIGGSFALARRPPSDRWGAVFYFLRVAGLATLLTVGVSVWLANRYPDFSDRALLAPVALLIGFVDWGSLLTSAARALLRLIDSFRAGGTQ